MSKKMIKSPMRAKVNIELVKWLAIGVANGKYTIAAKYYSDDSIKTIGIYDTLPEAIEEYVVLIKLCH